MVVRSFAAVALLVLVATAATSLRETFDAAAKALAAGDLAAAERGFDQVLKAAPNHLGALGNLGVVYSRQGRIADAVTVYRRALTVAPHDPSLLLNLGLAYVKQEEPAKAKPLFAEVVQLQPANLQARELLASTQVLTGEARIAVGGLKEMRAADPRNGAVLYFLGTAYLKLGEREKAREALDALMSIVSPAQAQFLLGKAYYESDLHDDAAAALEKALELDPAQPDVQLELGKTYVSMRLAEKAEAAFRETLKRRPSDVEATYFLGALLAQDGRLDEGIRYLEAARSTRPEFWGAYYYLGRARLQQGDAPAAVKLLKSAAERKPDEPAVLYQLARALKAVGRDDEARQATAEVTRLKGRELDRAREALVAK